MVDCSILQNFINNFVSRVGYYPGYSECFQFLQTIGFNSIDNRECMKKFLNDKSLNGGIFDPTTYKNKPIRKLIHENNGNISAGVL